MGPHRRARLWLFALCSFLLILTGGSFLLTARTPDVQKGPAVANPRAQLLSEGRPSVAELATALGSAGASEAAAEDLPAASALPPALQANRRAIAIAARAFLGPFSAYEVGRLTAPIRARLQALATPSFARRLLDSPPLLPASGAGPPGARDPSIEVVFLPDTDGTPRAQVSGTARRGRGTEPFSFVFERQADGWLASGVGE